jgi:hypothetical protein
MSPCFHSPIIESRFLFIVAVRQSESLLVKSGLHQLNMSQCLHPTGAQHKA